MNIPEKFLLYWDAFVEMLETFGSMSDGHSARMNIAKPRIDLTSEEVSPIHTAPYRSATAV